MEMSSEALTQFKKAVVATHLVSRGDFELKSTLAALNPSHETELNWGTF